MGLELLDQPSHAQPYSMACICFSSCFCFVLEDRKIFVSFFFLEWQMVDLIFVEPNKTWALASLGTQNTQGPLQVCGN